MGATRARIDALTAAGHSLTELARAIGKPLSSLRRSLSRRAVTAQTAMAVEALYDALTRGGAPSKLPGGRTTRPVPVTEPAARPPARTRNRSTPASFISSERLLHRASGAPLMLTTAALAESLGVSPPRSQAFSKRND